MRLSFFFVRMPHFAALGAYIIDYIMVLVPGDVYLSGRYGYFQETYFLSPKFFQFKGHLIAVQRNHMYVSNSLYPLHQEDGDRDANIGP